MSYFILSPCSLELQSGFARRVCERLHPSVVAITGAVERDRPTPAAAARRAISPPTAFAPEMAPPLASPSAPAFFMSRDDAEQSVTPRTSSMTCA